MYFPFFKVEGFKCDRALHRQHYYFLSFVCFIFIWYPNLAGHMVDLNIPYVLQDTFPFDLIFNVEVLGW